MIEWAERGVKEEEKERQTQNLRERGRDETE